MSTDSGPGREPFKIIREWFANVSCEHDLRVQYTFYLSGGSQKRCTKGGDRVRVCITHLLSIQKINIGDFHVSVAINI